MSTTTESRLVMRRELAEHQPVRAVRIPLSRLRVHHRHVRQDLGDLSDLANSLIYDGQHQQIKVEKRGDFYLILDGHRRFGAATIAGLGTLRAEVVPAHTDGEAVAVMLTTGLHTKGLSSAERAHAVRVLVDDEHMPTEEVAARCGVTAATIRRWYNSETGPATGAAEPDPAVGHGAGADVELGTVEPARRPRRRCTDRARRRGAPTTVGVRRLSNLVDRWASQCEQGLSAEHGQALLAEIRALITGPGESRVENDHAITAAAQEGSQ